MFPVKDPRVRPAQSLAQNRARRELGNGIGPVARATWNRVVVLSAAFRRGFDRASRAGCAAAFLTKIQQQSVFAICNWIVQITEGVDPTGSTISAEEDGYKSFVGPRFSAEFDECA
jgi:hypothetical protein